MHLRAPRDASFKAVVGISGGVEQSSWRIASSRIPVGLSNPGTNQLHLLSPKHVRITSASPSG